MLDGVFDQRLQHERWNTDTTQAKRHVDRHAETIFESRPLDVEIRLDDVNFTSERRELPFRCEDTSQ